MARWLLWGSFALPGVAVVVHFLHPGPAVGFLLPAVGLIPLAWLIAKGRRRRRRTPAQASGRCSTRPSAT